MPLEKTVDPVGEALLESEADFEAWLKRERANAEMEARLWGWLAFLSALGGVTVAFVVLLLMCRPDWKEKHRQNLDRFTPVLEELGEPATTTARLPTGKT